MKYRIQIDREALRALAELPKKVQRQIRDKIDNLGQDPFPQDCTPIRSAKKYDIYRIKSGHYRIAYQVKKREILILVVRIGHRKDFYKYFERR